MPPHLITALHCLLAAEGKCDINYLRRTTVFLLQEVTPNIDKCARPTVIGQLCDERFSLLNEEFEGCGGGLAEAHCMIG